jgi:hypothetical protein
MRNSLFGEGKISEDMNFDWLTKTISTTYTSSLFILLKTIKMPTREDWDEVKLMYRQ